MSRPLIPFLLLLLFALACGAPDTASGPPGPFPAFTPVVPRFGKFELSFPLRAQYRDPYDPAEVSVTTVFSLPDGGAVAVPGFFAVDLAQAARGTAVFPVGPDAIAAPAPDVPTPPVVPAKSPAVTPVWRVRFTPEQIGTYAYVVTLTDPAGTATLGSGVFAVAAMPFIDGPAPSFVHSAGRRLLRADGLPLSLIGLSTPWPASSGGLDGAFKALAASGANLLRVRTCSVSSQGASASEATPDPDVWCGGAISQSGSQDLDRLFSLAEQVGLYLSLTLKQRDLSAYTVPDQRFLRYAIARWGSSPSLLAWELCRGCADPATLDAIARDVQAQDPYHHLRTTDLGTPEDGVDLASDAIWANPRLDLIELRDDAWDCRLGQDGYPGFDGTSADPALHLLLQLPAWPNKPVMMAQTALHRCGSSPGATHEAAPSIFYAQDDRQHLIVHGQLMGAFLATGQGVAPQQRPGVLAVLADQVNGFPGLRLLAAAVGQVPDNARLFTSFQDDTDAVADPGLWAMGRKGHAFALVRVKNAAQTWANLYQDKKPARRVRGTVRLLGLDVGDYGVSWLDARTGKALAPLVKASADDKGLVLRLPGWLSDDVVAIVR